MTVRENLAFGAAVAGIDYDSGPVLEIFPELEPHLDLPAFGLSGGQAQMLSFGRGLMSRPRILLLDEPTLGLAAEIATKVIGKIKDLAKSGIGVLLVEQSLTAALDGVDRVFEMTNGTLTREEI